MRVVVSVSILIVLLKIEALFCFTYYTSAAEVKREIITMTLIVSWRGRWPQSVRRDPRLLRKWGSGSSRRIVWAAGQCRGHRRHRRCRWRSLPPGRTDPLPDPHPDAGSPWNIKKHSYYHYVYNNYSVLHIKWTQKTKVRNLMGSKYKMRCYFWVGGCNFST